MTRPLESSGVAMSRAGIYKLVLERIDALPPSRRERVHAHLDPSLVARVRATGRLGWFEYEVNQAFDRALLLGLGEADALRFWEEYGFASGREGLFRAIVEGAIRVFGGTPGRMLRRYADSYHFAIKNQGIVTAHELGENAGVVRMDALPEGIVTPGFVVAQRGGILAALRLAGAIGEVSADTSHQALGSLVFHARWTI